MASLFYDEEFLRQNLSPNHGIFHARVFAKNRLLDVLRGKTIICIGNCVVTELKATGNPPHLAISGRLSELTQDIERKRLENAQMKESLLSTLPVIIASRVTDEIRENFVLEGVAPLSLRDIDTRIEALKSTIVGDMCQIIGQSANIISSPDGNVNIEANGQNAWRVWNWGDEHIAHFVPPGWNFPDRLSVKSIWDMWFYGNTELGIRPYKLLVKRVDIKKKDNMKHTRARKSYCFYRGIGFGEQYATPRGCFDFKDDFDPK